jgi:hypothetical protein
MDINDNVYSELLDAIYEEIEKITKKVDYLEEKQLINYLAALEKINDYYG